MGGSKKFFRSRPPPLKPWRRPWLYANLLLQHETEGIHHTKHSRPLCQYHCRALRNVFVHEGGKLEKRQFLAKMHQFAPNCVSNFKNFPRDDIPDPHSWGGDTPSPDPSRAALRAWTSGLRPLDGPPDSSIQYSPWNKRLDKALVLADAVSEMQSYWPKIANFAECSLWNGSLREWASRV